MSWDEGRHPRVPRGGPHGGEFLSRHLLAGGLTTTVGNIHQDDEFMHPDTGVKHTITYAGPPRSATGGGYERTLLTSHATGVAAFILPVDAKLPVERAGPRPAAWADQVSQRISGMSTSAVAPRQVLENAASAEELSVATRDELRRITGHRVKVDWSGMDLEVAKHQAEGILRGAELIPVRIDSVGVFGGPSGDLRIGSTHVVPNRPGADISFNRNDHNGIPWTLASYTEAHDSMHRQGHVSGPRGDLTHAGSHEYAHVITGAARWDRLPGLRGLVSPNKDGSWVATIAERARQKMGIVAALEIGLYSSEHQNELWGELFADYVARGAEAHRLSILAVNAVRRGWQELKL